MRSLCAAFVALEAVDAMLTMWAVNNGFIEVNRLMSPVAGTWVSPAVKIVPAALAAWLLVKVTGRWPRTKAVVNVGLASVVTFMAAIIASNLLEL
jgi:hypothetical protein